MKKKSLLSLVFVVISMTYIYGQTVTQNYIPKFFNSTGWTENSLIYQHPVEGSYVSDIIGIGTSNPTAFLHISNGSPISNKLPNYPSLKVAKSYYHVPALPGEITPMLSSGSSEIEFAVNASGYTNKDVTAKIESYRNFMVATGPTYRLDFSVLNAAGSSLVRVMYITSNERVGIGTSNPSSKLHISAGTLESISRFANSYSTIEISANSTQANIKNITSKPMILSVSNNANQIYLGTNGSVGIGTSSTYDYKLAVAGTMITEGIYVKLQSNWPDYVFNENYDLKPLNEVKSFIKENKHLPGIPSANEIGKEGVDLGEMNILLLQKIEELTIYTIQQQDMIDKLNEKIDNLELKLNK